MIYLMLVLVKLLLELLTITLLLFQLQLPEKCNSTTQPKIVKIKMMKSISKVMIILSYIPNIWLKILCRLQTVNKLSVFGTPHFLKSQRVSKAKTNSLFWMMEDNGLNQHKVNLKMKLLNAVDNVSCKRLLKSIA